MEILVAIFTIAGVLVSTLMYFSREKARVTVCCTRCFPLAQKPESLREVEYTICCKDKQVENLWEIDYTLKNSGNRNIVGRGSRKSLVSEGLPLYTKNVRQILYIAVADNERMELRDNTLFFKQWLPGEEVLVKAVVESTGERPALYVDEHDIINAKVDVF